jgi:hypothetical protein
VNGREVARTIDGVAIAVFSRQGTLIAARDILTRNKLQVPLEWRYRPLFQMTGVRECRELQPAWQDASTLLGHGRFVLRVPAATAVVVYLGQGTPLPPQVIDSSDQPQVMITTYNPTEEDDRRDLQDVSTADRLVTPPAGSPFVSRVEVVAPLEPSGLVASVELLVKGLVGGAVARLAAGEQTRMPVLCRTAPSPLFLNDHTTAHYILAQESQDWMFGEGWYPVERDGAGAFRWTGAEWAQLWVPLAPVGAMLVRLEATSAVGADGSADVALRVNGVEQGHQKVVAGQDAYEWTVPAGAWVSGNNRLEIGISSLVRLPVGSHDDRALGLKVRQIGLVSLND